LSDPWSNKELSILSLEASAAQTAKKTPSRDSIHGISALSLIVLTPVINNHKDHHLLPTVRRSHHHPSPRKRVLQKQYRTRKASHLGRLQNMRVDEVDAVEVHQVALDAEVIAGRREVAPPVVTVEDHGVVVDLGVAAVSPSVVSEASSTRTRSKRMTTPSSPKPMSSTPNQPTWSTSPYQARRRKIFQLLGMQRSQRSRFLESSPALEMRIS
jgi:hypothetical protein